MEENSWKGWKIQMPYLTKVCQFCGKGFTFDLSLKQIAEIEAGVKHIQVILPEMPPETRELFISGICPKCWDEIFSEAKEKCLSCRKEFEPNGSDFCSESCYRQYDENQAQIDLLEGNGPDETTS